LTVANSQAVNLVLAGDSFLIMIVWTILKFAKKSLTLYVPVIFLVIHAVDINMIYWDKMRPTSLNIKNKDQYGNQILYYLLLANVGNLMDIKKTVFLFVPIYLCGHVAQLKREAILLNMVDPLASTDVMKNPITAISVNNMVMLAFLIIA
jgi:hypothetical protein